MYYPFGRNHPHEHTLGWLAHRLQGGLAMTESSPTEQTNALLAAVVASSMDAVFSIDTSARIQTWNSAAEQLYGYTAAEAIGQPLGLLAPDPTNYAPGTSRPLQPIRKDLVIRFRRQRLAREAIMAAKEISVKKYVVRLSG